MSASRNAQFAQPLYERPTGEAWQQTRLELLKPQQQQRVAKRRREAAAYAMVALLVFCAAFAYMYFEARIAQTGREVNDLQRQVAQTETQSLRLELEIGNLSSLSRIESYAKLRLNMVYPDVTSVQYLNQQVSSQLASDLGELAAASLEPEQSEPTVVQTPLLTAWADLFTRYFAGTAWAAEN